MAVKQIDVPGVGSVLVRRHRGAKRMTLRVNHDGQTTVTIPSWASYRAALSFVTSKQDWIAQNAAQTAPLTDDLKIGKAHRLAFNEGNLGNITTRIKQNQAIVTVPLGTNPYGPAAQEAANRVAHRALQKEANSLLPQRLEQLATAHGYSYSGVRVRQLKSRWGSCTEKQLITLNYYLIQLPWRLIDYVLVHELVHTKIHAHNKAFWDEVARCLPDVKMLKKEIQSYKPTLSAL